MSNREKDFFNQVGQKPPQKKDKKPKKEKKEKKRE